MLTCGDSSRAMGIIGKSRLDLIVMDVQPGNSDKLDILHKIRNSYKDLPVILCAAYPAFKNDSILMESDFHLVKSSNMKELKDTVMMALEVENPKHVQKNSVPMHAKRTNYLSQYCLSLQGTK